MNSVFRVYKYPVDYAAYKDRNLTPGDFVEKYPSGTEENFVNKIELLQNPIENSIKLKNVTGNEQYELYSINGHLVWNGSDIEGVDFSFLNKGCYVLKIMNNKTNQQLKLIK